jgi:hypothetical protein
VRMSGRSPSDIAAALGVIAELSTVNASAVDETATDRAVLGACAVHIVEPLGATPSYSVSSQSSSIDSCAVRFCSCGHRCSGTYTPRVATCSIESVPGSGSARQMSYRNDGGEREITQ